MTGFNFFSLGRICFLGLIYCDGRRLVFFPRERQHKRIIINLSVLHYMVTLSDIVRFVKVSIIIISTQLLHYMVNLSEIVSHSKRY